MPNSSATGTTVVVSGSNVVGTPGNDEIAGGSDSRTIYGGAGADAIAGSSSGGTIYGGSGNDQIFGHDGVDALYGGSGDDSIHGGNGTDTIVGGLGADALSGGSGADTFKYSSTLDSGPAAADTITDFAVSDDVIDLSAIDATSDPGVQHFTSVTNSSTVLANEVNWFYDGTQTVIQADVDGNAATVEVRSDLTGNVALLPTSFILS